MDPISIADALQGVEISLGLGPALGPVASVVIPAAISAVGSLFGAKKGSDAEKGAARIQSDFSQRALDEQRRVYDLEQAEERRQRSARRDIFGRYGMPQPKEAPYGPSDTIPYPSTTPTTPGTPQATPQREPRTRSLDLAMQSSTPSMAGAEGSTVTLQAPTGEVMNVPLTDAPALIKKGAVIIPKQGGQNAFGVSYGMV